MIRLALPLALSLPLAALSLPGPAAAQPAAPQALPPGARLRPALPMPRHPVSAGLARAAGGALTGGAHLAAAGALIWTAREVEVQPLFWLGAGLGLLYPFTAVAGGEWLGGQVERDAGADAKAGRWGVAVGYLSLIVAGPTCGALIDDDLLTLVCLGAAAASATGVALYAGHQAGTGDHLRPPAPQARAVPVWQEDAPHPAGERRAPALTIPLVASRF